MLQRYINDKRGSVAVISALGATSLLIVAGAAIELSALTKSKDRLQDAADSAVLAAAVSSDSEKKERMMVAEDAAKANYNDDFNFKMSEQDSQITIELSSKYETVLMGMFGYDSIPISAMAGSEVGTGGKLNIALALDTTLSMEGARMSAMIDAATDLIKSVKEADKDRGNAKMSIVPFADYVRIDPAFRDEDWIDVEPDHESTWQTLDEANSVNCRQVGSGESIYTECDSYAYNTHTATVRWEGCMVSRPGGLHKTAAYNGSPFKGNAGHTTCNGQNNVMTPMTSNFSQLEQDIEALQAKGKTYLPAGLQWAWRSLEEEALFTEEEIDTTTPVQKVLLLMTDGSNTASLNGEKEDGSWDGLYHWGSADEEENQKEADALTLEMCTSIKASGIRLVTVAYEVDDNDTLAMLKSCASTGADFYNAKDATKLKTAFGKIGAGFSKVRLTL